MNIIFNTMEMTASAFSLILPYTPSPFNHLPHIAKVYTHHLSTTFQGKENNYYYYYYASIPKKLGSVFPGKEKNHEKGS